PPSPAEGRGGPDTSPRAGADVTSRGDPMPTTPVPPGTEPDLAARCAPIELLVLDVDGVLTDGVIALDDGGGETKHFHARDGWALAAGRQLGKRTAILSGRVSKAVARRAAELGIEPVVQGASSKLGPFRAVLNDLGLEPRQACYVGDDLPDLP